MRYILFLASVLSLYAYSKSMLISSVHSLKPGQAEILPFSINCINECFFSFHLVVSKFDMDSSAESGAMYRLWNKEKTAGILLGLAVNKKSKTPEITVQYFGEGSANKKVVLGGSKIEEWEGFKVSWNESIFNITNMRVKKYKGYSQLKESGISHKDKLFFKPHSMEYLFLGVDLKHYLDIGEQNINEDWRYSVSGN
ncbi:MULTISPECIES: hypothetical protein [unclassified Pseudoalteromonas]|uniref:hypothetical protein n=1 Tax=unclassified Pseudoalteromonas TaxID=194690 RepID=UPI002097913E|nr:hypothetical protein [Pseudoalteromonas sp. XMcav2-N]MCO7191247.1 hypothetical protein [Pseudoalteromonas sp. XMcav2-N]